MRRSMATHSRTRARTHPRHSNHNHQIDCRYTAVLNYVTKRERENVLEYVRASVSERMGFFAVSTEFTSNFADNL